MEKPWTRTEEKRSTLIVSRSFYLPSSSSHFFSFLFHAADRVRLECIKRDKLGKGGPGSLLNDAATCVDGCSCCRSSSIGSSSSGRTGMIVASGEKQDSPMRSEGAALIHCLAGVSRSATVAIGYLMKHLRFSLDDSYRYTFQFSSSFFFSSLFSPLSFSSFPSPSLSRLIFKWLVISLKSQSAPHLLHYPSLSSSF